MKLFSLAILFSLLQSCAVYTAQPIQPILVKEKGKFKISPSLNLGGPLRSTVLSLSTQLMPIKNITTHVNGNLVASGMQHINAYIAYGASVSQRSRFDFFAGALTGGGSINFHSFTSIVGFSERWKGTYNMQYLGIQYRQIGMKNQFGINCRVGKFNGNYLHTVFAYDDYNRPDYRYTSYIGSNLKLEGGFFLQYAKVRKQFRYH